MRYASLAALLLGCSSSADLPPPEIALYVGHELDNWSAAPAATRLQVDLVSTVDGAPTKLLDTAAPPSVALNDTSPPTILTLPDLHFTETQVATFQAHASTAAGDAVVRGSTVPFGLGALEAVRIPLFVGRVGEFSRPPDTFDQLHLHPLVVALGNEYVIAAGGDAVVGVDGAVPDIYDQVIWTTLHSQPPLPRAPKSMAIVGILPTPTSDASALVTKLLVVDAGGATWLTLATDETSPVDPPAGLDFSEIAGGDAIALPDGSVYIVGATRHEGDPTDKVLRIDGGQNGEFAILTLGTPRLGASAAVVGKTLVVAGGTDAGTMVEVLSASETSFTPTSFAADATVGFGIAALDSTIAVAAGGKDPATGAPASVRTFDTTCATNCTTTDLATLPVGLDRTRTFVIDGNRILVLGEGDDGQNRAFLVDTASTPPAVDEKNLREPRKGATPTLLPNGQVGLLGGQLVDTNAPALTLEIFIP